MKDIINLLREGNINREEFYQLISKTEIGTQYVIKTEKAKEQLEFVRKERVS